MNLKSVAFHPLCLIGLPRVAVDLRCLWGNGEAKHRKPSVLLPILANAAVKTLIGLGEAAWSSGCDGPRDEEGEGEDEGDSTVHNVVLSPLWGLYTDGACSTSERNAAVPLVGDHSCLPRRVDRKSMVYNPGSTRLDTMVNGPRLHDTYRYCGASCPVPVSFAASPVCMYQ